MSGAGLASDLQSSAGRDPQKTALIFAGEKISYAEVNGQVDRVAAGLHRLGVRRGDRVVFAVGNRPSFVALHYGTLKAGAVSVPLDTRLKAQELRTYLNLVTARVIVADEAVASEVMSAGPHSAPVFVIGKHPTARPFEEILSGETPPGAEIEDEDPAVIAFTSGASGPAKPVMLTHGNISSSLDQLVKVPHTPVGPQDVIYAAIPLFHVYALNVLLGLALRQGATVLLEERFDPAASLEAVASHGVTVLAGVPPMFTVWLGLPSAKRPDLSKVRFAICGGAALSPRIHAEFKERFGIEIWEGYGLTETSSVVTTTRMGDLRPGSVGKALPGQELKVVDESGVDVVLGDPGEVWVRGPNVFRGYWEDEESTRSAFTEGWFRTGDIAYQDEEGYLWLLDRNKEVIQVSGFKVYPGEVERVLRMHEAVADAAVVGEADARQGQKVKAVVILKPGRVAGEEDLIVHCTRYLARFKVPSEVVFTDELPRLDSGKILKRELPGDEPVEFAGSEGS